MELMNMVLSLLFLIALRDIVKYIKNDLPPVKDSSSFFYCYNRLTA